MISTDKEVADLVCELRPHAQAEMHDFAAFLLARHCHAKRASSTNQRNAWVSSNTFTACRRRNPRAARRSRPTM